MIVLVVGATGATGKLLVKELLNGGHQVRAVVRSPEKLDVITENRNLLSIITATVLEQSDQEMIKLVSGCDAVASCLGHNLNFKGIYGNPRRLVTDSALRICEAIKVNRPEKPIKYVLMNTTGNSNRDLDEPRSFGEKIVIGLIRLLLPPQVDNEKAADYLRTLIGQNDKDIEWAAVRPDNLIDAEKVTEYEIHPSPVRSAIFNPGQTSRINVAHFMANLATDELLWAKWKGKMPVIYNKV